MTKSPVEACQICPVFQHSIFYILIALLISEGGKHGKLLASTFRVWVFFHLPKLIQNFFKDSVFLKLYGSWDCCLSMEQVLMRLVRLWMHKVSREWQYEPTGCW